MADDEGGKVAQAMALAVAGEAGVPGAIGALVMNLAFPSGGLPSYFGQVYAEVSKIVNQAILDSDIAKINGTINGTQQFVRSQYTPDKADPKRSPSENYDAITPYVTTFYEDVVSTLREEHYAQAGFPAFLLGASVHLSLLQEQAITDPDHQDDPRLSPSADAAASNAALYADFAESTWPQLIAARRNAVSVVDEKRQRPSGPPDYYPIDFHVYYWLDSVTGEKGDAQGDPDSAAAQLQPRQDAVEAALRAALGNPEQIIASWRTVAKNPLVYCEAVIHSATIGWGMIPGGGGANVYEWDITKAAKILLGDRPVDPQTNSLTDPWDRPDYEQYYNITAIDRFGQSVTASFTNRPPSLAG